MKEISIIALLTITVLSCNSASESKDADVQAPPKKNETACDCIEVMHTTLDGINTWTEFLNVEAALKTTAPECEEIMTNPSVQDFVMKNCNEAAVELEVAYNEKIGSFIDEMSNESIEQIDSTLEEAPEEAPVAEEAVSDSVSSEE